MKLREKMFITLLSTVVIFVSLVSLLITAKLRDKSIVEKKDMCRESVTQILLSAEHVTDEIERYVYDMCRSEEIASTIGQLRTDSIVRIQMANKLTAIINYSPFIVDGFVIDLLNDDCFYANSNTDHSKFTEIIEDAKPVEMSSGNIKWLTDQYHRAYVVRKVYQTFPKKAVALAVFEVNMEYLKKVTGLSQMQYGNLVIIDSVGYQIFHKTDDDDDIAFFERIIDFIRAREVIEPVMNVNSQKYHVITKGGTNGSWNAVFIVRESELLSLYTELLTYIVLFGALTVCMGTVISWILSLLFNRHLYKLKNDISLIKQSPQMHRINVISKDEIGELASEFNTLLDKLDCAYEENIRQTQRTEYAKYELLQFQYKSLQAQISPHFLSNILSCINLLSLSGNVNKVERLSIDSSRYLREYLISIDKKTNSLAEELIITEDYIHLMSQISATEIILLKNCQEDTLDVVIPNMILQPFVENSVKYGMTVKNRMQFTIEISSEFSENRDYLYIRIADDGIGFPKEYIDDVDRIVHDPDYSSHAIGYGTLGVLKRLRIQYPGKFDFTVSNSPDGGALTTFRLPCDDTMIDRGEPL